MFPDLGHGFFSLADFKVVVLRTRPFDGLVDAGETADGTDDAGAGVFFSSVFVGFAVPFERPCCILNVSNVIVGVLVCVSAEVCDGVALVWLLLDLVV